MRRAVLLVLSFLPAAALGACRGESGPTPTGGAAGETPTAAGATVESAATEVSLPTAQGALQATAQADAVLPRWSRNIGVSGTEPGMLRLPFDVAVNPDGSIWVADSKGVQKLDAAGELLAQVDPSVVPLARAVDSTSDGTVFVAGHGAQVLVFDPDGQAAGTLGEAGRDPGQLHDPVSVAVASDGAIYVADAGNRRVEKFAPDRSHVATIGGPGQGRGEFSRPWSLAVGPSGDLYVSTADDYLIQRFDSSGAYVESFGRSHADENLWQISGLSLSGAGILFALQVPYNRVQAFDVSGEKAAFLWEFGELGTGPRQFSGPTGSDISGGLLYIADTANDRIQVLEIDE
jgi:streptogramin lyase